MVAYKSLKNNGKSYKTVSPKSGLGRSLTMGRGTQRRQFLSNTLMTLFRLPRVLSILDVYECILSIAIKFVSVRSSWGNLSPFEITRALVLFSRKFSMQFDVYNESEAVSDFSSL